MKKWSFWAVMCMVSLANGGFFFAGSLHSMRQGVSGADNQAALLFIPLLLITAVFVLVLLNIYTLICGIKINRERTVDFFELFHLSGISRKAWVGKIVFIAITCLLTLFGGCLFAPGCLSAAYALSGGLLLVLLYAWVGAARQKRPES